MDVPDTYLGADLSEIDNEDGDICWAMSSDKYCQALVQNVENVLSKKGFRLPSKCFTPLKHGYKPELDCTCELKADGLQWYQELIGSLRWAVEIGRVDILLETRCQRTLLCPEKAILNKCCTCLVSSKVTRN